jgi:hypothetical protein
MYGLCSHGGFVEEIHPASLQLGCLHRDNRERRRMAKTLIVQLTCDRCTAEKNENVDGTETVSFGFDGYSYSLDLCAPHAEDFHATVQSLISWSSERSRLAPGRRAKASSSDAGSSSEPTAPRRQVGDRERLKAIREWARKNGYPDLSERGRIPQRIIDEYEAAKR